MEPEKILDQARQEVPKHVNAILDAAQALVDAAKEIEDEKVRAETLNIAILKMLAHINASVLYSVFTTSEYIAKYHLYDETTAVLEFVKKEQAKQDE